MRDAEEILIKIEKKKSASCCWEKAFIVQLLGLDGDFASWGVTAGLKELATKFNCSVVTLS